jgi:hypothetical protein
VLLDQVPPPVLLVSVIVDPGHTVVGPTIGPAPDNTDIVVVTAQPLCRYVIIDVPRDTPFTIPDMIPTPATPGVLLVQNPPAGELVSGVVAPTQILGDPDIGAG